MAGRARNEQRETERQCAVTRERRAPGELLRFAVDPDGNAVPDLKSRLPGRGVWVTCTRETLEKAVAGRVFDRSFRKRVNTAENLPDLVEGLLERDALQRLALANKAGDVVCGFDKVYQAVQGGKAAVLVHASDASPNGCRKLDSQFEAVENARNGAAAIIRGFNCEELSLALGRPNVIHAALKEGGPCRNFMNATARLERFRAGSAAPWGGVKHRKTEDE